MSVDSIISLIDLSKQLPFSIDDELKKDLCFGETLVISCGHYQTEEIVDDESLSEWSCRETEQVEEEQAVSEEPVELKDRIEEEQAPEQEPEDDDDFHFFFFPDCNKPPPPKNSKASIVIEPDGMPRVNPAVKAQMYCTCNIDKQGKCTCHIILPCKCGAKIKSECTCNKLEEICICNEAKPNVTCTCKNAKVCTCFPNTLPKPVCTCDQIEKPCVCHPDKFPSPVCICERKPKFNAEGKLLTDLPELEGEEGTEVLGEGEAYGEGFRGEGSGEGLEGLMGEGYGEIGEGEGETERKAGEESKPTKPEEEPCICQVPEPKKPCLCLKGKECTCNEATCICGVQKTCICEPTESQSAIECKSEDSKSICSCPVPRECTCDAKGTDCKCFPKPPVCTCGDPENCKCLIKCVCKEPCICDTLPKDEQECICLDKTKPAGKNAVCTCPCKEDQPKTLKKVRAGKQGYRWCHEVDPRHTYFDYGYDQHHKIDAKEQEKEKFKILGLYDEKKEEDVCPEHGAKVPRFKKKPRKPSLDCCSAVGGISICVETLGEDADKFLVQVVSNSSKEGAKTGSKLVSILDTNLHTLEENRIEYIAKKNSTKERRSYMALCESGYYNKVTRICGDRSVVKRLYHSFEKARNFLLEGANVVLMRYFGLLRYRGTVKTETVLMDGTVCESIYFCPGVSQAVVNNTPLYVVKVERHIIDPSGFVHQTLTVLTLKGRIVSHEWADNNYMLHVNPLLKVDPQKDEIERTEPLRAKWREDLQLLSDYLNFKSTRSSEGARFMAENGALTATIRDYLQAILLLKPQEVLHFTRHYFSSAMSALDLPHDDYYDSCPKHVRYFYFEE